MPESSADSWRKHLDWYKHGMITSTECLLGLFESVTPENVHEFISACPEDVYQLATEFADEESTDDREWPRIFTKVTTILSDDSEETRRRHLEREKRERLERQARIRKGVRIFRAAIANRD